MGREYRFRIRKLTLSQLCLSSRWLTQNLSTVAALNDSRGVGEDGAAKGVSQPLVSLEKTVRERR